MRLCFATNNLHKLDEVKAAASGHLDIVTLKELSVFEELPETKDTFEGNALQKALYVLEKTGVACFADDSGLEVEWLKGAPGVYSARYAGPRRNDDDNIDLLLKNLAGVTNRKARFKAVIALAGIGDPHFFEGVVEGEILTERRGTKGFGYDPVFRPTGYQQTFGEMEIDEKNRFSHRAIAIRKLVQYLESGQPV